MKKAILLFGLLGSFVIPSAVLAQSGYSQTNLVSNTSGVATTTDSHLVNPWGISALPGQDFWIANNNNGTSTLYDGNGHPNSLVVTIPGAGSNPNGNCTPGLPYRNRGQRHQQLLHRGIIHLRHGGRPDRELAVQ